LNISRGSPPRADTTYVENVGPEPGWLIFKTPPTELGIHPTDGPPAAEVSLMCDDIEGMVHEVNAAGASLEGGISDQGWGLLATVRLPSGAPLGVYQPRHPIAADTTLA